MKTSFSNQLFLCAATLALGILRHTTAQAQLGGVPLWTNRWNGPGNGHDQAYALAVDSSGSVFVTGQSIGSGGSYDYATIKYSGVIPPSLTVARTPTNTVAVSWPSPSTGFNLQVNTDLTSTNWSTPGETVQDNGTIKYIIVNPPNGNRYYRLKNP